MFSTSISNSLHGDLPGDDSIGGESYNMPWCFDDLLVPIEHQNDEPSNEKNTNPKDLLKKLQANKI